MYSCAHTHAHAHTPDVLCTVCRVDAPQHAHAHTCTHAHTYTTHKCKHTLDVVCTVCCVDTPDHEDGTQAARWALLGYGKDGSRPAAVGAAAAALALADRLKGVPERGAELLHALLNGLHVGGAGSPGPGGGGSSSGSNGGPDTGGMAGPVLRTSREEALGVAAAAVAVADLALEEDVALLLATANLATDAGSSYSSTASSRSSSSTMLLGGWGAGVYAHVNVLVFISCGLVLHSLHVQKDECCACWTRWCQSC